MQKMIKVNVTKLDIERGTQGNSNSCPVARALRRAIKLKKGNQKNNSISVRASGVMIKKKGKYHYFNDRTSQKRAYRLHDFVLSFDAGLKVEPCKLFLVTNY